MDSLQALLITRDLKQALASSEIAVSTVFTNPTVVSLANAISVLSANSRQSQISHQQTRQHAIDAVFQEHKNLLDNLMNDSYIKSIESNASSVPGITAQTVVLTGSTGALGSYLLQVLSKTPSVSHIYCLDRAPVSSSIRSQRNKTRKLATESPADRVTFLTADISQQNFGLELKTYDALLSRATAIIHSAWPVKFNLPLSAFGPQLVGITRLVEFVVSAAHSPSVFFVSSVSSVLSRSAGGPWIPEDVIFDANAPSPMGYGESKYVAELLLNYASEILFIDARIARVGQIAGPVEGQGTWNEWEWLPSLVLSSAHVGAVPDSLGSSQTKIDWVPIDLLADVLVELTLNVDGPDASKRTLPDATASVISDAGTKQIETVSFRAWLDKVRAEAEAAGSADVEAMLKANPAAKLLGFYEKLAEDGGRQKFDISRTEEASPKLRAVGEIKPEWMERWVSAWLAMDEKSAARK